ncbi:coiled-coil domain-containing protein 137 isoform X1 [Trichoplusia ni]|uniref:Coiled-coil domain-containing protein 137 isoform X1 n=1 Tax=Trichoplusia ni TaxID=7111 RepID=A0A7E5VLJ1_TRINI|nr:coiled-coil domain-containing protein 137 isoform X1 [Trichoplusia ni]XP_026729182.1 coiled-coil domain-containing protein 137 isoform X1 [Trichoplusia ni]
MGRKIPAKKHRGVKDPLVQQAKRLESLTGKINAPPKDPDEQPIPKSLTRLFAFQEKDKQKVARKARNCMKHDKVDIGSPKNATPNPISQLRKLPGESGRGFSLRINSAVRALHNPCEDVDYPVDIEAEDEKGLRMAEQRERRARKRRKAAKGLKGGGDEEREPHLTRTQKLSLKKKARKIKEVEAKNEKQEVVYEKVSFGEVCHAPPSLQARSKGNAGAARPARRGLLLSTLLAPAERQRRDHALLPPAERQRRERARADAVAAYRALKANKINNK